MASSDHSIRALPKNLPPWEKRTPERCLAHYEVEKELATRLRDSTRAQRQQLYNQVYDEMYRRVPDHPMLARKLAPEAQIAAARKRLGLLRRFLSPTSTFLEIGAGDCAVSREIAPHVAKVVAVEVSEEIAHSADLPDNASLVISDGIDIPVADGSIDVALSDQLMEHLHPDDALDQLANIYRALAPGGIYVCITPSRISGPHDISMHFDEVATCFHLREYSFRDLGTLFRQVGFSHIEGLVGRGGRYVRTPEALHTSVELALSVLPRNLARKAARTLPFQAVLGVQIIGRK
jgi:SAM-dependent methyltransferase